jgi:hypothetical protein
MASLEQRLAAFRQLPLRAQLATIASTKANNVLSQKKDYIASLEQIHAESLEKASEPEKLIYQKSQDLLDS